MEGGRGGFRRVGRDLDLHLGYLNMGLSEAGGDNRVYHLCSSDPRSERESPLLEPYSEGIFLLSVLA